MPTIARARAVWALGFGLVGLAALVGRTSGQDNNVQRTNGQGAGARPSLPPAVIGCVDMDALFKGYKKVEFLRKQMETEAEAKKGELNAILSQAQQLMQEMEKLQQGSEDFRNKEGKLTELKASLDARREQAQREFALREAEALATVYKEIQAMVAYVAQSYGMTYVLRTSNEPVSGADPNSAVMALSRAVVYSDGKADVTNMVLKLLNQQYAKDHPEAAAAAPAANPTPGGAAPAPAPRGNAAPASPAAATPRGR